MANLKTSAAFWDEKAKENAHWYISSFGPYAGRREEEFWASGQQIWRDLKAKTGYVPRPEDVVVEIGCGIGRLTRAIAPEVGFVHAFDISAEMLRRAQEGRPSNVQLHLADGDSLRPLEDSSADLVLAYCVFQHLPSYEALANYLREMARVARPGALIAFTTVPRDWRAQLLPVVRMKSAILSPLRQGGPRGLYRKEWVGIRPSRRRLDAFCPFHVEHALLDRERLLFWGRGRETNSALAPPQAMMVNNTF